MGEARALNDLGNIFVALGEFESACKFHTRALAIREEIGNKQATSTSLINLGKLHIQQRQPGKALEVLHRALDIAVEIKAKPRIYQANLALSDAHELEGDMGSALVHYKIYQVVKEEVSGDQANARVKNLQVAFEVEKAEREAEIARLRNVELKETNDRLEQLVKELNETQTALVQSKKMAALGALVAGLVHEMNSPLGVIASGADVSSRAASNVRELIEGHASDVPPGELDRFRRSLDALEENNRNTVQASKRIRRIVAGLKSFARLDESPFQKADLNRELETTLSLLEYRLGDRIEIVRDFGKIPKIDCYPGELNQVFLNLITNAIEAIDGSGTITISTRLDGDHVRLKFADTGVGIPADQLPGLFDPVFSAKGRRVKAGLGLFTCYNIVSRHNGDITVESSPGVGTTFTVLLPAGP
jgi:signal transduction histidine kinase